MPTSLQCRWCEYRSPTFKLFDTASENVRVHAESAHPKEYAEAVRR